MNLNQIKSAYAFYKKKRVYLLWVLLFLTFYGYFFHRKVLEGKVYEVVYLRYFTKLLLTDNFGEYTYQLLNMDPRSQKKVFFLVGYLKNSNPKVRAAVLRVFVVNRFQDNDNLDNLKIIIPGLIIGAFDKEKSICKKAIKQLSELNEGILSRFSFQKKQALVHKLIQEFSSKDQEDRVRASTVLVELGKESVPALLLALNDPSEKVRINVVWSLGKINLRTPKIIEGLKHSLKDPAPFVRTYASFSLIELGEQPPEIFPEIIELLGSTRMGSRRNALRVLKKAEPAFLFSHYVPILIAAEKKNGKKEQRSFYYLLSNAEELFQNPNAKMLPSLFLLLQEDSEKLSYFSLNLWKKLELNEAQLELTFSQLKQLKQLKKLKKKGLLQEEVLQVLIKKLTINHKKLLPYLEELLLTSDGELLNVVSGAIANFGENSIQFLVPLLGSKDKEMRLRASSILVQIGEKVIPAVLVALTKSKNPLAQANATWILGKLKAQPESVVPALIKVLGEVPLEVQVHVIKALGNFGGQAKGARVPLKQLLEYGESEDFKELLQVTLNKIEQE